METSHWKLSWWFNSSQPFHASSFYSLFLQQNSHFTHQTLYLPFFVKCLRVYALCGFIFCCYCHHRVYFSSVYALFISFQCFSSFPELTIHIYSYRILYVFRHCLLYDCSQHNFLNLWFWLNCIGKHFAKLLCKWSN